MPNILLKSVKLLFRFEFIYFGTLYGMMCKKSGKRPRIQKPLRISPEFLELGDYVVIWKNARIEGVKQYNGQVFQPNIILEDYVSIQQNLHLTCANRIVIRKNAAIAANVTITDINHLHADINIPIESQNIVAGFVEIGEGSKVYNNAVILPGVHLGKNSVVAANSVVKSGVYPDYCILAGNPARIVRQYNTQSNSWE
jgi:acetyltransferase-like isoleucine patch superfamily enzyme